MPNALIKWTSLGGQWDKRSMWLLELTTEGLEFPPKPKALEVICKFAPHTDIVQHNGRSLQVMLPVSAEETTRASIGLELGQLISVAA
ncbi:MAG: hypothetical protein WC050_03055 [Candidatus Paceibacterota bacterium]